MMTFGQFQEVKNVEPEVLLEVYQHVDNGGYTFIINKNGNLGLEFGFFGYTNSRFLLSGIDLDGLAQVIQEMKKRLDQEEVVRRLKGE